MEVEVVLLPMTTGRRSSVLSPVPAESTTKPTTHKNDQDDAGGIQRSVRAVATTGGVAARTPADTAIHFGRARAVAA